MCREAECVMHSINLVQFAALCITVVVPFAKPSITETTVAMRHTSLLNTSLGIEATVVVPDSTACHHIPTRTVCLVVVATACVHSATVEFVSPWCLATTGIHSVVTPTKAHVSTTAVTVWAELFKASPGVPSTVVVEETTTSQRIPTWQSCHTVARPAEAACSRNALERAHIGLARPRVAVQLSRTKAHVTPVGVVSVRVGFFKARSGIPAPVAVVHTTTCECVATWHAHSHNTSIVG